MTTFEEKNYCGKKNKLRELIKLYKYLPLRYLKRKYYDAFECPVPSKYLYFEDGNYGGFSVRLFYPPS